jgi:hypothetical protein
MSNANFTNYKINTENCRILRIWSYCPLAVEYTSHARPVNNACSIDPLLMTPIARRETFSDNENLEKKGWLIIEYIEQIFATHKKSDYIWSDFQELINERL